MAIEHLLWRIGAVQRGSFRLSSGRTSNIYVDLRRLPSHPEEYKLVLEELARRVGGIAFDVVCGIAVGGLPLSACLAHLLGKPLIYVRKDRKNHGTMRQLEGDYTAGERAIIVDDVATTGGSIIEAARVLRSQGLVVEDAIVVVDREEGAREALEAEGLRLHSLTTLRKLLEVGQIV
ncbi:MAG: orotate phosphoribosyltransferase [Infirmifilum sp.]